MSVGEIRQNRLYGDLAYLWPLMSPPEEYAEEADMWRAALQEKLGPGRHHILELGVGGGHLLSHLIGDFTATAVDLSEGMLEHSRRLNPDVQHVVWDMRTVRLGRTFDAVIIHDAIGYMLTEEDLRAAFATAAAHLNPGGLFITAPDWFRETFPGRWAGHAIREGHGTKLTYFEYHHDPDPDDNTLEALFVFLIEEHGELRIEMDRHTLGVFPVQRWHELLSEAGFSVERKTYPAHADRREAYLFVGTLQAQASHEATPDRSSSP